MMTLSSSAILANETNLLLHNSKWYPATKDTVYKEKASSRSEGILHRVTQVVNNSMKQHMGDDTDNLPQGNYFQIKFADPVWSLELKDQIARAFFAKQIFTFWVFEKEIDEFYDKWVSLYLPSDKLSSWPYSEEEALIPTLTELRASLFKKIPSNPPNIILELCSIPEKWLSLYYEIVGLELTPSYFELICTLSEHYGLLTTKSSM